MVTEYANNGKMPPHDLEAERATIGSIFVAGNRAGETLNTVLTVADPEAFYRPAHGAIIKTMEALRAEGQSFNDIVLLGERLQAEGQLEEVGGWPYLTDLAEAVPHAFHTDYYAGIVREKARLRRLGEQCRQILEAMHQPGATLVELRDGLDDLRDHIDQAVMAEQPEAVSIGKMIDEHPREPSPVIDGIIRQSEVGNVIAPPKIGKSWLAYGLALSIGTGGTGWRPSPSTGTVCLSSTTSCIPRQSPIESRLSPRRWPFGPRSIRTGST